jgi:hypothetical protein
VDEVTLLVVGGRRGRPARAGHRSMCRVQVFMTSEEKMALKNMATSEGKKIAEIVRDATNEYVADFGERRVFRSGPFE